MSKWQSKCRLPNVQSSLQTGITSRYYRFVDCEKWRKEFKLDDLVQDFDYNEKQAVFEYYPQYYHKTDKVCKNEDDSPEISSC